MKKSDRILIISLILVLAFCFGLVKDASAQMEQLDSQKRLKEEIQLLNLLKGLYLSDEQLRFLIARAKEAQQIRENYNQKQKRYADTSIDTLERLKDEISEDRDEVSKDVAREIHQSRVAMLQLKAGYEKDIEKIVAEVKNNLASTQIYIFEEFKPCLVPPKGPARFGQANDAAGSVKHLERIREMPDYRYSVKKYELADKVLERALPDRPKEGELDEGRLRSEILTVFEQARSLSDVDFGLKKEELASELKQKIRPGLKSADVETKIERFLLSPVIIGLLEESLKDKGKD